MADHQNRVFHRKKIMTIFFVCAAVLCGLLGRLLYLMVWRAEYYEEAATRLHERERSIKAARGRILDRNGVVLADNKMVCTVSVIHNQIEEPEQVIAILVKELGISEEEARKLVKPVVKEIKNRFGDYVYSTKEEETLEQAVVKLLKKYDLTMTTAESCTGGLLAGRIINVPGASEVYNEGFITYSNKAKRKYLDVSKSTLKKYGAVSEQTAREMATGGVFATDSDACVAVTGLAGPDGGTEEKPVGLVYIATYMKDKVSVEKYQFKGNRDKIREQAVVKGLDLLRRSILDNYR